MLSILKIKGCDLDIFYINFTTDRIIYMEQFWNRKNSIPYISFIIIY